MVPSQAPTPPRTLDLSPHAFSVAAIAFVLTLLPTGTAALTPTTIILVSTPNPSTFGQAVTLMATVSPAAATGKMTFYDGMTMLGTRPLSGQAVLITTLLPSGIRSLRAYYTGDATFASSTSGAVAQKVVPLPQNGFLATNNYSAGSRFAAVGDFNSDGKADLVLASANGNFVSILLGNGDATFQAPAHYNVGIYPSSIAIGDFNGDGKADLAVANSNYNSIPPGSGNVSVLLGNGDGTFQTAVNYDVGFKPFCVATGDFNGDGKADLVVLNLNSNNVSVLLGNGDGTFQPPVNYTVELNPISVAIGDFNGDGNADLVVANVNGKNVSVLLGNGDGTFQPRVNYSVAGYPNSVAAGDVNGDGKADLLVANQSNNVSVLLGNGDGTFQAAVNFNTGINPVSIAIADVNGDGKADLAMANLHRDDDVSVLLGNGDGTFQAPVNYSVKEGCYSVAVGDFNGDGRVDLVVAIYDGVGLLLGAAIPDLTISKAHVGNFTQGQTGASYSITVSNVGGIPTAGVVTVTDTLPADLTATAIGGTGWTCALGTLTCTRSDSLGVLASYPAITLTVNVAIRAAASLTNTATVSGGGDNLLNNANNTATDPTAILQGVPILALATNVLQFHSEVGSSAQTANVAVSNTGGGTLSYSLAISTETGGNWLLAAASTTTAPGTVTITVNPNGLAVGAYRGKVLVTAAGSTSPAAIVVELAVAAPQINTGGVVNGASFTQGAMISRGSISSLFGTRLATDTAKATSLPLPKVVAGAQVLVNGSQAPLFYVAPTQINFQMPPDVAGTTVTVRVLSGTAAGLDTTVNVAVASPGIFTLNSSGSGAGAVLNQDYAMNSPDVPATVGSVVSIYATGLGAVSPPLAGGQPGATGEPFNRTVLTPVVTIGGQTAELLFSAVAPGFVGLYQINARIPAGVAPGSSVLLTIQAGGVDSNQVTIAVR